MYVAAALVPVPCSMFFNARRGGLSLNAQLDSIIMNSLQLECPVESAASDTLSPFSFFFYIQVYGCSSVCQTSISPLVNGGIVQPVVMAIVTRPDR